MHMRTACSPVAPLGLVAVLAAARRTAGGIAADERLERVRRALPPWASPAGRALGALGGHAILPPVVVAAVVGSWRRGRRDDAVRLVAASAGADVVLHLLRAAVDSHRPGEGRTLPATASFPSGHATTSLTIGTALGAVAGRGLAPPRRRAAVATGASLGALAGLGRWLDGRRAASDVAGGLLLGAALLQTAALVERRRRRETTGT